MVWPRDTSFQVPQSQTLRFESSLYTKEVEIELFKFSFCSHFRFFQQDSIFLCNTSRGSGRERKEIQLLQDSLHVSMFGCVFILVVDYKVKLR